MSDFFELTLPTKDEKSEHEKGVQRIRDSLNRLHLPLLPPHIVNCDSYHPDVSTRIEGNMFTVIDYVNTEGQLNFDIGGLFLLLAHKDIVQRCVAVVGKNVYPELVAKVKKYRSPYLEKLVILREDELDSYLKECMGKSYLWQPDDAV